MDPLLGVFSGALCAFKLVMSSTRCARFLCPFIWVSTVTTALSGSSTYPASGRSLFYSFDIRKTIKKKKKKKRKTRKPQQFIHLPSVFLHLLDVHSINNTGQKLWKNSSFFIWEGLSATGSNLTDFPGKPREYSLCLRSLDWNFILLISICSVVFCCSYFD